MNYLLSQNTLNMLVIIISIFLLTIIVNAIIRLVKRAQGKKVNQSTTLNCGIFAWAGKNTKKFNKSKFDILGIYNDERGGQGSGITKNGDIFKSSKPSKYKDFLTDINYDNDLESPVIFGHTRKSSSGSVNAKNNHPFGFGFTQEKGFEFTGVHNGTLYNENDLARKFEVDRSKIDSHILLECIYKSKSFKVLKDYVGAAALVFYNLNDPNVLYVFRGESSKYESDKTTEPERPLFYYQETRNSLYISSIENSLIAITEKQEDVLNIEEFKTNIVYKITDGNVKKAIKFKINRKNSFQREYYSNYSNNSNMDWTGQNHQAFRNKAESKYPSSSNSRISDKKTKKGNSGSNTEKVFKIKNESHTNADRKGGNPIWEKFNYTRNGHPVTGIFINTLEEGLLRLDEDYVDAVQIFNEKYLDKVFDLQSQTYLDTLDQIDHNHYYIPFMKSTINKDSMPFVYIVDGIRVCHRQDYEAISLNDDLLSGLEYASYYPMLNTKGLVTHKGSIVNHIRFSPIGSKYVYTVLNGEVTSRKRKNNEDILAYYFPSVTIKQAGEKTKKKEVKTLTLGENTVFEECFKELEKNDVEVNNTCEIFNLPEKKTTEEDIERTQNIQKIKYFSNVYLMKKRESLEKLNPNAEAKGIINLIDKFVTDIAKVNVKKLKY